MTSNLFDISGRVAVVTGGRRGLGLAMSEGLAAAGAKIACIDIADECDELRNRVESHGSELAYFQADLSDRSQRKGLVDRVVERFGRLDILVNSRHPISAAGDGVRPGSVGFILNLMLTAVFELSQQAARVMDRQGGGKIINIASVSSFQGGWTVPAYTAAKHGVAGLTKALANEWASKNIHVNAIAPGYFDTDMCAAIVNDPVREPQIRCRIPAGRWGQPRTCRPAVVFGKRRQQLCGRSRAAGQWRMDGAITRKRKSEPNGNTNHERIGKRQAALSCRLDRLGRRRGRFFVRLRSVDHLRSDALSKARVRTECRTKLDLRWAARCWVAWRVRCSAARSAIAGAASRR